MVRFDEDNWLKGSHRLEYPILSSRSLRRRKSREVLLSNFVIDQVDVRRLHDRRSRKGRRGNDL